MADTENSGAEESEDFDGRPIMMDAAAVAASGRYLNDLIQQIVRGAMTAAEEMNRRRTGQVLAAWLPGQTTVIADALESLPRELASNTQASNVVAALLAAASTRPPASEPARHGFGPGGPAAHGMVPTDQLATHSPDDGQDGAGGRDPNWPPPDDAMADAIGAHLREAWPEPFGNDEVFCEQVSFEASRAVLRHQMAAAVRTELSALIAQRPVTPGRPEDGPYPATLDEVADEVAAWMRKLAPSLPSLVVERLATTEETPEAER